MNLIKFLQENRPFNKQVASYFLMFQQQWPIDPDTEVVLTTDPRPSWRFTKVVKSYGDHAVIQEEEFVMHSFFGDGMHFKAGYNKLYNELYLRKVL